MRKITLFSFIFLCLMSFLGTNIAHAADKPLAKGTSKDDINYLFIETAESGSLKKNADNESYTLTLKGIDPWVTFFSDVPYHVTGFKSVKDFSTLMNDEVKKSFPKGLNSGLVTMDQKNKLNIRYMISLENPQYDVKNETVTFTAYPIPGEQTHPLPDSKDFGYSVLFIDSLNICVKCGGKTF